MSPPVKKKKIIIAVGGTGGHLFPAQILATQLRNRYSHIELVFVGAQLNNNRYFSQSDYLYYQVDSATLFQRRIGAICQSIVRLLKGVWQSIHILKRECPDLIIGFGSFHSFPVLCAARLRGCPVVLFESNIYPGKVNALFSSYALMTAIVFSQAQKHLKGKVVEVILPVQEEGEEISAVAAREYFGLSSACPIILVFGGSQGALKMNLLVLEAIQQLDSKTFQIIHLIGKAGSVLEFEQKYREMGVQACVKQFETNMSMAYRASHLAICRAGASTISELIAFELPAILIPFPYAADDHQTKNAQFMQDLVKGAIWFSEKILYAKDLKNQELGKESPQNPRSVRKVVLKTLCRESDKNCDEKSTPVKIDSSSSICMTTSVLVKGIEQLLRPNNLRNHMIEYKKNANKKELWSLIGEIIN